MQIVPRPIRPCRVIFINRTELPLTAVSAKFMVASRLQPGAESRPTACPSDDLIEVQFAHEDTPYDDLEFAELDHPFVEGGSYRIIVSGEPGNRSFSVVDEQLA